MCKKKIRKCTHRWSWPARLNREKKYTVRKLSGKKLSANESCDN
jgi:hypothetical protein